MLIAQPSVELLIKCLPIGNLSGLNVVRLTLSQALVVFDDHIPDIRKACVENIHGVVARNQPSKEMTDDDELTIENIKLHLNHIAIEEKGKPMMNVIKRIDGLKKRHAPGSVNDEMIANAKDRPIKDLFIELTGDQVRRGMAHCPFHPDATASLSLGKYNRFHCFGCDEKGDTITLYMKLNNCNFIQAVKELQ